jgi:PKD repeat protein
MTIRGCKIHDIGIYRQNPDAEGIGTNGVDDLTVENNEFYNCGTAFQSYPWPGSTNKNIIIRWNYVHDMHQLGGARGTGIAIGMDPPNEEDLSGNQVYGNIVANCPSKGYSSNYDTYEIVFYNNVAYNCEYSFYFNAVYRDYTGPNITLRNNISLAPKSAHIYFGSATSEVNYTIDSDYNLFYPDMPTGFAFKESGYSTYTNFSGWQAVSRSGCTFDLNSLTSNPQFTNSLGNYFNDTDFRLQPNSPAIDAGIDVGLTQDFEGNPVPQGNAPDIGAYECVLFPVSSIQNEPKEGCAPLTVSFDGSQSASPNGDIVSYEWDFGDGSTSTGIKTSHIFTSAGEYTVTLTVTDDPGLKGKSQTHIMVFEKKFGELPAGCYNNVFNPAKGERALIAVELQKQARVRLNIYNTRGNKIRELADEEKEADTYRYYWDGRNDSGNVVGSGLYFVHIQAGDYKKTKKIVVVK